LLLNERPFSSLTIFGSTGNIIRKLFRQYLLRLAPHWPDSATTGLWHGTTLRSSHSDLIPQFEESMKHRQDFYRHFTEELVRRGIEARSVDARQFVVWAAPAANGSVLHGNAYLGSYGSAHLPRISLNIYQPSIRRLRGLHWTSGDRAEITLTTKELPSAAKWLAERIVNGSDLRFKLWTPDAYAAEPSNYNVSTECPVNLRLDLPTEPADAAAS
jgi:hypothetical protein